VLVHLGSSLFVASAQAAIIVEIAVENADELCAK